MLSSGIPVKFNVPWASGAGGGYITEPIPVTTASPGRASLTLGFPPSTFEPEASGGNPPWGADANGILNQVTAWQQWMQAGGWVGYDAAFSAAISGYPNGALIKSATAGHFWLSGADNNATDPDTGGANWSAFPDVLIQAQAGNWTPTDIGAVNAPVITLWPQPVSWTAIIGAPLRFLIGYTNTTNAMTLGITGLSGTKPMKNIDGTNPVIGQLTAAGLVEGFYDGTNVQIASPGKPIPTLGSSLLPPGAIVLCPVEIPFAGTLECNGASLLRSSYPNLFNVIGTRYGAADGNYFNLPDMRGMFPRGWDHGRGIDPSASTRAAPSLPGATGPAGDHVGTTELAAVGTFSTSGGITISNPTLSPGPSDSGPLSVTYDNYSHFTGKSNFAPFNTIGSDGTSQPCALTGNMTATFAGIETRPINIDMMYVIAF